MLYEKVILFYLFLLLMIAVPVEVDMTVMVGGVGKEASEKRQS